MAEPGRTDRTAWDERALLRAALSSVGDAVITTDAAGNVGFLNPVAQGLTGWTQEAGFDGHLVKPADPTQLQELRAHSGPFK